MKFIKFLTIGLIFISCGQNNPIDEQEITTDEEQIENLQEGKISRNEEEIRDLIRQVLKWSDSKDANLWTMLADDNDSICIGLNMKEHKKHLDNLKKTDFFAAKFIENYNKIILELDKKIKNNEFGEMLIGDIPSFNFASDVNPWCSCQEILFDDPNHWDVDIKIICLNDKNGELEYTWGKSVLNTDPSWGYFKYKFKVTKEKNKWKISYMEGFDFEEGIK
jgi:hypothetical protein